MKTYFAPILLFIACLLSVRAHSQARQQDGNKKPTAPKVTVYLGGHKNGDTINRETAKLLLSMPLQILDSGRSQYTPEIYQFLYRRRSVSENPQTGKAESTFTISAGTFSETPLPKIWIENVGLNLKSGEELYFFDIVLQDKQKKRFRAPNFKLFIR